MRLSFFVILLVLTNWAVGQPIIVTDSSKGAINVARNATYIEDSVGMLQVTDMSRPEIAAQFRRINNESIAFGLSGSFFWIRIEILNTSGHPLFLKIDNNSLTDIQLFEKVNDSLKKYYHTGNWMPFSKREVKNVDHLISLHTPNNLLSVVYLRVVHNRGTNFPLFIGKLNTFYEIDGEHSFEDGMYYGIMLLMILYNIFIYFYLHDRSYLYYVIYIFLISLFNASMDGYAFRYFWPNLPIINRYEDVWGALVGIAAILFASNFLNIQERAPYFYKVFAILLLFYLVTIGVILTGHYSLGMVAMELITVLLILFVFLAAYTLTMNGYKPAQFFLFAWTLLLVSVIVFILKDYKILPYNRITVNALQIGSALEAVLLSIALADRINIYRSEKAKAQHELIASLNEKSEMKHNMLELESAALRAQMNPHFIFNCMNSIKWLIKQKEEAKAIDYLTTFSKLLRTILHNAENRAITLFDEIETCRLYIKLESMRFEKKFIYSVNVDETLDLRSVSVPALILQTFIENAIWHGLLPANRSGFLRINITEQNGSVQCIIDDNGIGRVQSLKSKVNYQADTHQSRGISLTQSRLEIDNALNNRNTIVEIHDKIDPSGEANGTTVTLTFKQN